MEDTLTGKTLDESADKLGISHSTAWSWRHKIMEKMKSFQEDIMLSDRSELDEKHFHKSQKGKKLLGVSEPKKRGTPARKRGISGIHLLPYWRIQGWSGLCRDIQMGKSSQDDVENIAHHFSSGASDHVNQLPRHRGKMQLTHIDAFPDNFLFDPNAEGELSIQLTDWEYAGMQDKHVDIAMFCIYSMYGIEQIDKLIDIYFEDDGGCDKETRAKIYCYVSVCGLIWSNWCEYKRNLGVEFGEYSLYQY